MEQTNEAIKAFNNIIGILKEIRVLIKSKKGRWQGLCSNKAEKIEGKFKEALQGTRDQIESSIWYGKGFAIGSECGIRVDREFHDLMGLLITKFSDISLRLDAEKLDDKLAEHLQSQLTILSGYAQRFWSIQGISSHQDKEGDAMKIIEDFRGRLWDFTNSMEPYLKKTPAQIAAENYANAHS